MAKLWVYYVDFRFSTEPFEFPFSSAGFTVTFICHGTLAIMQATEYVISQTKNNIQFLQSINLISSEDARQIISKLPGPDRVGRGSPHNPSPQVDFPLRPGSSNYRAIWGYNENGQVNTS